MPVTLELHEQRHRVTTHVGVELRAERVPVRAMMVEDDSRRFVPAAVALGEYAVPHLRILAATRCSGAQPLVEVADEVEARRRKAMFAPAPIRHTGTPRALIVAKKSGPSRHSGIPTSPPPLEGVLRLGFQLGRKNQPGDGQHFRIGERDLHPGDPVGPRR